MYSALPMHTLNTLLLLPVAVDVVFLLDSFDLSGIISGVFVGGAAPFYLFLDLAFGRYRRLTVCFVMLRHART